MAIQSINPATGETLREFSRFSDAQVEDALQRAQDAFGRHRRLPPAERAARMVRAAEVLEAGQEEFARTMTLEMGKTLGAAREEVLKCARCCRFYAEHAGEFLADRTIETESAQAVVRCRPLGAILAIMPWNFPFWQVIRFAVPALMAGNVGLLKHAPSVPQCALALERVFREAGFEPGAFQALLLENEQVPALLADTRVVAATLTGSEAAGSDVAARAGAHLKKTVLELGGSDPFVVTAAADLDAAAETAVSARTINNGQSCIAAKRFLVAEPVADAFLERFLSRMRALRVGDPLDPKTDIGPLATPAIRDRLDDQVRRTVAGGARLLLGGERLAGPGCFYAPTVLSEIPVDSPARREEFFGPVALVFRFHDLDEAIQLANETPFGLGASVWTQDPAEQERLAEEIEAGMVFVNAMVASDPRLPFGGIKRSGYGRELSAEGIREFVNIKTVCIVSKGEAKWEVRETE